MIKRIVQKIYGDQNFILIHCTILDKTKLYIFKNYFGKLVTTKSDQNFGQNPLKINENQLKY